MKFVREWKGCLLNKNNTVLKANDLSEIPKDIETCTFKGNICATAHVVDTITYGICQATRNNETREYPGVCFESRNGNACFDLKLIKQFIQKSSKYYLPANNSQMIIENKNYVILIAPMIPDNFIPEVV